MNRLEYKKWENAPKVIGNSYELLWEASNLTFKAYFYECIFQLNTDKIWIKAEVDGLIVLEEDLNELHDHFNLSANENTKANEGFSIREYSNRCWHWKPPIPMVIDNTMKIYMKSSSGNKRVERGRSVWGEK